LAIADQLAPRQQLLAFDGFTLDLMRGVLTAEARQVVLRPKTAAVLAHLLVHAGQVVSRDALLSAVWGDVAVTDDSLTQCISEIRRALGPGRADLLQTYARRGYMMATRVRPVTPAADPPEPSAPAASPGGRAETTRHAAVLSHRGVTWAALAIGGCGLALAAATWLGEDRAPGPTTPPVPVASAGLSPSAQARQALLEGQIAQQGAEPFGERLRRSLPFFLRALALDPTLAEAAAEAAFVHTNLRSNGTSLDPEHDLREAERLAALAMAAAPEAPISLGAQAAVLRQQRRFAEAIVFYERGGADPERVADRANAGIMYLMLGDAEAALPRIRAAVLEAPDHRFAGGWRFFLGLARLMAGQPSQAADDFLARGTIVPVEERLLYRLVALRAAGRVAEAEVLDADLRQRDPALLARPLYALSQSDEAAYRARIAAAVLEPLHRMGWVGVGVGQ
jgi:DNA-binding winged helix-turn-helix (wHTH) protein/tetratricopeptide (TPR) repeat protein